MSADPLILVHVKLAPAEFYWTAVRSTTQQMRKLLVLFGFVGLLSLAGLLFATFFSKSFSEWQQTIRGMYLPMFAFIGLLPFMVVFLAPLFSFRKFFADPVNAGGTRFQFSDSGVITESAAGKTDSDWKCYVKAQETFGYFLLYSTFAEAQVIPKRCLSTPAKIESLRVLFRRHIPTNNLRSV